MIKLLLQAVGTFVVGVIALGAALFLAAGTVNYWQAWVFVLLFMILVTQQGIYLAIRDPELLERRKKVAAEGGQRRKKSSSSSGF